jgi:hypothetical protein
MDCSFTLVRHSGRNVGRAPARRDRGDETWLGEFSCRRAPVAYRPPMTNSASWVELVGDVIVARLRGETSEALLRQVQEQVLELAADSGRSRVLLDVLEMTPPPVELTFVQRKLDEDHRASGLRRAIVVPNSRLAYLARLAFGEGDYRVFYNDMIAAVKWLGKEDAAGPTA